MSYRRSLLALHPNCGKRSTLQMGRAFRVVSLAAVLLAACLTPALQAGYVVAPNAQATDEGNAALFTSPFNTTSPDRYQQIYGASQFGSTPQVFQITQITFRPDAAQTTAFSGTFSNVQIDLSTTGQTVAGLSSTFASNVGANDTVVYSGGLSLSTANVAGTGTAKAFDITINLATPFTYDTSAGNLLLDIRNFSGGLSGLFDGQVDSSATITRLVFAEGIGAVGSSQGNIQPGGLVTRFTTGAASTATVPDTGSTLGLLGLGVGVLLAAGRRSCTQFSA